MDIGKDWRISSEGENVILSRRLVNKKTGKEYWKTHGYFSSLTFALLELVNQSIRDTELKDLRTVCDKIDQLRKDILNKKEK